MSDPTRTSQSTRHATGPAGAAARTPAAAVAPTVRRPLAAAVRALITATALTGLALAALRFPDPPRLLADFTLQANLAAALGFAFSAHRAWTGRRPVSPRLTGALLVFLTLAALTHHLTPPTSTTSPLLATATPLGALADWLLLTAPRTFRLPYAWQWPLYPLLHLSLTTFLSSPPRPLSTTLTIATAACLLPLITIAIDQVRPAPPLHRNRISPTGISPLK
ncbi:integral membrane regulator [Streptomyces sp. NPDC048483]|uniref:integral membrane regulator n=1 Tax=Streptomyces sp. NPDC048483 TaxID=3154927 RepID=UPI0034427748